MSRGDDEFRAVRNALFDGFGRLIYETEDKQSEGLLRTEERYDDSYEYGPFSVRLDSPLTEVDVSCVAYETDGVTLEFTADSVNQSGVYQCESVDSLSTIADDFETVWNDQCVSHTSRPVRKLREATVEYINAFDGQPTLDEVIEALSERNDSLVREFFGVDSITDDPELEQVMERYSSELHVNYKDEWVAVISFDTGTLSSEVATCLVGRDDSPSGLFVHTVDGSNLGMDEETTEAALRRALEYDLDIDLDDLDDPIQLRKTTRVQGDLTVTFLRTIPDEHTANALTERAEDINGKLKDTYGMQYVDTLLSSIRVYEVDSRLVGHINKSYAGAHNLFSSDFEPEGDSFNEAAINRQVGEVLTDQCSEELQQTYDVDADADTGWLNLPVDNHLLRFESAWVYPLSNTESSPVVVVVPEPSVLSVTHSEHPEKQVRLEPGLYEVGLLHRGEYPRAFTAPVW